MKIKLSLNKKGFSIVELLVALGMFGTVTFSLVFFATDVARFTSATEKNIESSLRLKEISNAILLNKNDIWSSMVDNTDDGTKRIVFQDNTYQIVDGEEIVNDITVNIFINSVMRNSSLEIVESSGFTDPETREIVIDLTWLDPITGSRTISNSFYVNNWNIPRWRQTSVADFTLGSLDSTIVTNTGDGAVEMDIASDVNGDWCEPSLTLTEYDMPGQGVAKAITAVEGKVSMGTGDNASGLSYIDVNVTNTKPPVATVDGSYNGPKTNDVFGETNYAYLATDTNNEEIVILDISASGTPVKVGYFDAPGSTNADAVYVSGNVGYAGVGNTLYMFDLTSKSGSRPLLGVAVTLLGSVKQIEVVNGYAYLALNSSIRQLSVVDVSNPLLASVVAYVQTNAQAAVGVYVNDSIKRAYFATQTSTTQNEVFIINTTTLSGNLPIIASYNVSDGMNPTGIVVPITNRAVVVGTGGSQQYQVLDITTETAPTQCGGLAIATGINKIDSITEADGDAWSYITTGDANNELKIIQGGPGGGGGNGQGTGYPDAGTYESAVFDTNSASTVYYSMDWDEQVLVNTDMYLQIRTGNTSDLSAQSWYGPDGTGTTYFTNPQGNILPSVANGNRYIQYKVFFSSPDRVDTPIFEEINIYYER